MPVNGPEGPQSRAPRNHHHTIANMFRKLKKKNDNMFVPPDVPPTQRFETYGGRPSPRPVLPVGPSTVRSMSQEADRRNNVNVATDHTVYLSPGTMGGRRISAPQLNNGIGDTRPGSSSAPGRPVGNVRISPAGARLGGIVRTPPPAPMNGYGALSIDTGHGETAGSGMGYVTGCASSASAQHEDPVEQLAKIRSVYDEKNRILNVVSEDILKLHAFISQYESEKMAKFADFDHYLQKEGQEELKEDIELAKSELDRLRGECPGIVPPPVPVRPRWNCLQCTFRNDKFSYRCEKCKLPCTRFDPSEKAMCNCEYCQTTVQLQLSPLQDDWMLVSQINRL